MSQNYQLQPTVNATQEFIEIANDFSNPLDIVREAISNAYDAKAKNIWISFAVEKDAGEPISKILIKDDGEGMDRDGLQSFFDLGNSLRKGNPEKIGEKGHGTKVYFNSREIRVKTKKTGRNIITAIMEKPFSELHSRRIPLVSVTEEDSTGIESYSEVIIVGYNNNRRDKFTHEILRDHILWFTKAGSTERIFNPDKDSDRKIFLKGLGRDDFEELNFGHVFPDGSGEIKSLFEKYLTRAPDYYCKRIKKTGVLKNYPEIKYEAIFSIEGRNVKYGYNNMIRRSGYSAPSGSYTIQERYGLWLCKDFIPVQRKNDWITYKGSEYTKFHAFFNCQGFRLTANRGSVENTPSEILSDIQEEVRRIFDDILNSDDWRDIDWLENEAVAFQTTEREKKNFQWRVDKVNRSNVAEYEGILMVEPERESGVFALFLLLSSKKPDMFPFQIIDYDTHEGIDVIAKGDKNTPISSAKLFYVEFKRMLTKSFNHSFDNLHSIVCWDTEIKHDETVKDINNEERKLQIIQPAAKGDYTKYFLDNPNKSKKIEVFVLKWYLREKFGIEFKPRTKSATV